MIHLCHLLSHAAHDFPSSLSTMTATQEFYEKGSSHGADAFIITEVTIVNTPNIDYND